MRGVCELSDPVRGDFTGVLVPMQMGQVLLLAKRVSGKKIKHFFGVRGFIKHVSNDGGLYSEPFCKQ